MEDHRKQSLKGKTPEFKLSCGSCKACCYHDPIEVDRAIEPPERLKHLDIVQDKHGEKLRKKDDGSCIHLGEHGCTVYEHRPSACRKYDCRVMGFFGINIDHGNGIVEPTWVFDEDTKEDKIIAEALANAKSKYKGPDNDAAMMTHMVKQFPQEKETLTKWK